MANYGLQIFISSYIFYLKLCHDNNNVGVRNVPIILEIKFIFQIFVLIRFLHWLVHVGWTWSISCNHHVVPDLTGHLDLRRLKLRLTSLRAFIDKSRGEGQGVTAFTFLNNCVSGTFFFYERKKINDLNIGFYSFCTVLRSLQRKAGCEKCGYHCIIL